VSNVTVDGAGGFRTISNWSEFPIGCQLFVSLDGRTSCSIG